MAMPENSIALLDAALDAAGGLDRWREHSFLSAHLSQAGDLWAMKGQGGVLDDVKIDVALHQEWVSHHPFGTPELRSSSLRAASSSEMATGRPSRRSTIPAARSPRTHSTLHGRAYSWRTSSEPRCGHTSPSLSA